MDRSLSRQQSDGPGCNSNEGGRGDYNYGDGGEMEEGETRRAIHPNKGDIGQSICMIFSIQ